jgi:hypothetical protein
METRIASFTEYLVEKEMFSESIRYHVSNNLSILESIYRPGSTAHLDILVEARLAFDSGKMRFSGIDQKLLSETKLGSVGFYRGRQVILDLPLEELELNEEKKPRLNYPKRGGTKKYHVYVRNPKTGRIMKIAFGDVRGGLTAKVSNPKARKSFAARHNCAEKKDRTKAGYWACRINRYAHLWGGKTYPGYW